jgi:thioredoxin reductase (NADPH)
MTNLLLLLYILPIIFTVAIYLRRGRRMERRHVVRLQMAVQSGLTEPPSLHPVISEINCIGCGSCATACPEHAIGLINGKGVLTEPAKCIGHGACETACPVEGITLVFGTEKRGIDIPQVHPNFETNVPGIFIAGELGGMGLIRKAACQGVEAIDYIAKKQAHSDEYDVVIVGAGPAGMGAALAAKAKKLKYIVLEQEDSLGGTIYHYPRNKIAMSGPVTLPIVGKMEFFEVSKEVLMGFWNRVMREARIDIRFNERMESIHKKGDEFVVTTQKDAYETRNVLLSLGRRGTPRKLGVPGEELPKVVYRLLDAEQYRGKYMLVVGGGDSALEAALALSGEPGTSVTLSYRSEAFGRVKEKNRLLLQQAEQAGKIEVLLQSTVVRIEPGSVLIDHAGDMLERPNDGVIVCAGGILPTPLLKEIGVMVETHYGTIKSSMHL